jgi:hypothetical protein
MSETKRLDRILRLATTDSKLFKPITLDIISLYEKGRMRIVIVGPAFRVKLEDTDIEIIRQKNGIDESTFHRIVSSILWVFHLVCREEVPEILQDLKKEPSAADALSEKVALVEEVMASHPTIRSGFYAYTLSGAGFFEEISWSAELRAFHSKNDFVPEPHSPYPIGRVTLTAGTLVGSEIESKTLAFDVTANDLGSLIESLQELKEALLNLQRKKLAET